MDPDASAIEFLSVGDLTGQAVRIYWRHAPMILQVLLIPAIGFMVGKICLYCPFAIFKIKDTLPNLFLIAIGVVSILAGSIILLYSVWIMMMRQFALVKLFVAQDTQADSKSFDDAYKKIKSMQGPILAIFSLSTLATMAAAIGGCIIIIITAALTALHVVPAGVIAGLVIAEFVGMLVFIIQISIIYWLALNQMILENEHVKPACSQSWLLAWPNFWRILGFVCLSGLVVVLLTWPLNLPLVAFSIAEIFIKEGTNSNGQDFTSRLHEELASFSTKAPFYRMVLAQSWESMVSIVTWPIVYFGWALFSQDLKKRAFAPDLLLKLQELKEASGGGIVSSL